ncbi:dnaJ homolog subfamily C member 30 isoform X1 [Ooceraea biroi]|uniref:dnaJ homolog subfamily C member 30 isoform X1 n=1 Tax=Ooceraea biroi TaxID=2015173 RepID=UPI000F073AEF|nr:dnaJ homolog subfamily C member 30 isoform X1 [Ooceraea biroi]
MPTLLMHSLLKSGMLNSSKSSLIRLYSTKQKVTLPKNHYDTLKVTPNATHNQIKSAYYKLTLQYHPDKNKSEYAKQKFQDISEAYEILGNHELRKNYDQRMKFRQRPVSSTVPPNTPYRDQAHVRPTTMYNFDAWIQAHYGRQFDMTQTLKKKRETMQEIRREQNETKSTGDPLGIICVFIIIIFMVCSLGRRNIDVPHTKKQSTD